MLVAGEFSQVSCELHRYSNQFLTDKMCLTTVLALIVGMIQMSKNFNSAVLQWGFTAYFLFS